MKKIFLCSLAVIIFNQNPAYSQVDFRVINGAKTNNMNLVMQTINPYNVNVVDRFGNTPLSYSLMNQNYEITNILLSNGARPLVRDASRDFVYCAGMLSRDARIRHLFSRFNPNNCSQSAMIKQINSYQAQASTPISSTTIASATSGGFSIGKVGLTVGAVALVGGGVAIAAGGGGGSDSGGSSGGGSSGGTSSIDKNYDEVGFVRQTDLDAVLNDSEYIRSATSGSLTFSNKDDFDLMRMAYAHARGFTGKKSDGSTSPNYLGTDGSGSFGEGDAIKIAIMDTGVEISHVELIDNRSDDLRNTNVAFNFCEVATGLAICGESQGSDGNPSPNREYGDGKDATTTNVAHGTNMAGLMVAADNNTGIIGVAPDAEIIPYKISLSDESFVPNYYIGEAFADAALKGASVINNSYGLVATEDTQTEIGLNASTPGQFGSQAQNVLKYAFGDVLVGSGANSYYTDTTSNYNPNTNYTSNYIDKMNQAVINNDVIFVFAAGNEGLSQPSMNNAIPLHYQDVYYDSSTGYYKNFVTVVNYDVDEGELHASSNKCGVAMEYCISAPGTWTLTTGYSIVPSEVNGYSAVVGTSGAAAIVSGAVAVIEGAFPYLSGAEITQLLFSTARDLGEEGVDEIYGWGMLDLERATRPSDALSVGLDSKITAAKQSINVSTMKLDSSIAYNIKSKDLKMVVFDEYNRTYDIKLNNLIQTDTNRIDAKKVLENFASKTHKTISFGKDESFNLYYSKSTSEEIKDSEEIELSYQDSKKEYGFNFYYGNNPYNTFVNEKSNFYNNFTLANSNDYNPLNPYFKNDSDDNYGFNSSFKISQNSYFNVGFIQQNYTMEYDEYDSFSEGEYIGNATAFMAGISYDVNENINTKIELGIINENETLFGNSWNGAFGIGENNTTYMTSFQTDMKFFNDKLSLIGAVNIGFTVVNESDNSLIKNISDFYSSSYAVGLSYNFDRVHGQTSNISFLISQPVKINSGKFDLSLANSRDIDGNIYYDNYEIDMKTPNETNFQMSYNHEIDESSSFNFGALYRDYIDNEIVVLFKYSKRIEVR